LFPLWEEKEGKREGKKERRRKGNKSENSLACLQESTSDIHYNNICNKEKNIVCEFSVNQIVCMTCKTLIKWKETLRQIFFKRQIRVSSVLKILIFMIAAFVIFLHCPSSCLF
jgi:hypothetical protein